MFSQLATQFSESEKEFCEGNDAGRFEQEVRELAAMVAVLKKGSLVFLNETFQSTAYAEGAEGLYHLLKHFSALNIRWILVSHLRQIEEIFHGKDVAVLHTTEDYSLSQTTTDLPMNTEPHISDSITETLTENPVDHFESLRSSGEEWISYGLAAYESGK